MNKLLTFIFTICCFQSMERSGLKSLPSTLIALRPSIPTCISKRPLQLTWIDGKYGVESSFDATIKQLRHRSQNLRKLRKELEHLQYFFSPSNFFHCARLAESLAYASVGRFYEEEHNKFFTAASTYIFEKTTPPSRLIIEKGLNCHPLEYLLIKQDDGADILDDFIEMIKKYNPSANRTSDKKCHPTEIMRYKNLQEALLLLQALHITPAEWSKFRIEKLE